MKTIARSNAFKRDYRKALKSRHGKTLDSTLVPIIRKLSTDTPLPASQKDHALIGNWQGYRECHIKPDLLLIYQNHPELLKLARLGSHSQLFS